MARYKETDGIIRYEKHPPPPVAELPWMARFSDDKHWAIYGAPSGKFKEIDGPLIATMGRTPDSPVALERAEIVIRAVNAHPELLDALEKIVALTREQDILEIAEAALAKAKGEPR